MSDMYSYDVDNSYLARQLHSSPHNNGVRHVHAEALRILHIAAVLQYVPQRSSRHMHELSRQPTANAHTTEPRAASAPMSYYQVSTHQYNLVSCRTVGSPHYTVACWTITHSRQVDPNYFRQVSNQSLQSYGVSRSHNNSHNSSTI